MAPFCSETDQNSKTGRQRQANPIGLRLKPATLRAVQYAAEQAGETRHGFIHEAVQQRLELPRCVPCWDWACGRCAPRKMAGLELALRELVAGKLPGARSARPPELRAKRLPEDGKARKLALQLLKRAGLQWLELRLWDGPAVTLVLGGTDGQKLDAADPQALVAALLAGADPRAVARGTLRVNGSRGDDGPGPALNARIAALCGRKKQDKPEPREDTDAPEALLVLGGVDRAAAALARYGVALVLDIDNPVHEPRCGLGEWAPAALASRLAAEREDRRDTKVFKRDEQLAAELKEGRERLCSELDTLRQHARMAWESGYRGTPAGLLDLRDIRRPAAAERRRA